jgi:hypothetical protein
MNKLKDFARAGRWPTLLSSFLHFDVSFMNWVRLGAVGNYLASRGSVGRWIARHGRVLATDGLTVRRSETAS